MKTLNRITFIIAYTLINCLAPNKPFVRKFEPLINYSNKLVPYYIILAGFPLPRESTRVT